MESGRDIQKEEKRADKAEIKSVHSGYSDNQTLLRDPTLNFSAKINYILTLTLRFGGESSSPELAVLDSTDLMCPGSLDVCCKVNLKGVFTFLKLENPKF